MTNKIYILFQVFVCRCLAKPDINFTYIFQRSVSTFKCKWSFTVSSINSWQYWFNRKVKMFFLNISLLIFKTAFIHFQSFAEKNQDFGPWWSYSCSWPRNWWFDPRNTSWLLQRLYRTYHCSQIEHYHGLWQSSCNARRPGGRICQSKRVVGRQIHNFLFYV